MDSKYTQKYSLALTVMAASMTAAVMMFYVFERGVKTDEASVRIETLEYRLAEVIEKLEQTGSEIQKATSLGGDIENLVKENMELREQVNFYKEKNEFLQLQVDELKAE